MSKQIVDESGEFGECLVKVTFVCPYCGHTATVITGDFTFAQCNRCQKYLHHGEMCDQSIVEQQRIIVMSDF